MTASWFKIGPISMKIKYVEWRRGTAYYRRRIPSDLQNKYNGKAHLFSSLKTDNPALAAKRSFEETRRIDKEWSLLRSKGQSDLQTREEGMAVLRKYGLKPGQAVEYDKYDIEPEEFVGELLAHSHDPYGNNPGIVKERLPAGLRMAAELFYAEGDELNKLTCPSFSEVIEKHLYFHPRRSSDPQFDRATQRFIKVNGDMPIDQFRRENTIVGNGRVSRRSNPVQTKLLEYYPFLNDLEAHGFNSLKLQAIDSNIMNQTLLMLKREHNVPALPIHDCLIVRAKDIDAAKEVFTEAFIEHAGVKPTLEVEL